MIKIRKATKEDVAYIAEGIYHAFLLEDKALYNQWIRTLKEVCGQEDTHYSYRNTWIAEVGGVRAGMMIAVDGEHYREQRDKIIFAKTKSALFTKRKVQQNFKSSKLLSRKFAAFF